MNRRQALTRLVALIGGIGAAFAAIPIVRYFTPSERAKALGAAVSVDISGLQPGQIKSVVWRGKPIMVFRRTREQLEALNLTDAKLLDDSEVEESQPSYVDPSHRSVNPEFLVLLSNCTHLGCVPRQDTEVGKDLMGSWWPGGFHCPCHDSMYDNAGRVVRGPAPTNLKVPPHYFAASGELVIGADSADA